MSKKNDAFMAGLGYMIGNIMVKGINFLAVPIFSRLMNTAEFGIYNVFMSYDGIFSVIIGLALHTSVKSASYEFKGEIDKYVSSITIIYIINAIVYFGIVLAFNKPLAMLLGINEIAMILLILSSFGQAILQLYNERLSLEFSYKKYLVIAFINSLGNILISLVLIFTIFKNKRDIGRLLGTVIVIFMTSLVVLGILYKNEKPKKVNKYWKFGIKYSIPIVPHGISQVLLANFDRIMISKMVGNVEAGIYSLAGNIKLVLTVISSSISTAWSTWFFQKIKEREYEMIQNRAALLCELFTLFSVFFLAAVPEIMLILGGVDYREGQYVAIPMIMDSFVLFLYNIIVPSEYYTKKTVYIMCGTIGAALVNIITNYIFIMKFGYLCAAYTTLFAYVCYCLFHMHISYRFVGFFVIPPKIIIIFSLIIIVASIFTISFINNVLARIIVAAIIGIILTVHLLKSYLNIRKGKLN